MRIYGLEASLTKRFDTWIHLGGSLTYAMAWISRPDLKLGSVAPLKGIFQRRLRTETWGIECISDWGTGLSRKNNNATFKAPDMGSSI